MRRLVFFLCAFVMCDGQDTAKLKVLLSVDMEGVAGTVTDAQLLPGKFEYERFRRFMTMETLAAIEGAKQAGATEIVVADAHGSGENLLIEEFPANVRIVRGEPRHLYMVGGLDSSFDAVMLIGYHASTHNVSGVRAHTFSSGRLSRVAVNGIPVTEGAWAAAIAGHLGVPVVFVSGDDAAIAEVRSGIGMIEAVETKRTLGFHAAETLTPEAAQILIHDGAAKALRNRATRKPYLVKTPVTVDISFKNIRPAETAAYLSRVFTRPASHSIRFVANDMLEASDIVDFLLNYRLDLEP